MGDYLHGYACAVVMIFILTISSFVIVCGSLIMLMIGITCFGIGEFETYCGSKVGAIMMILFGFIGSLISSIGLFCGCCKEFNKPIFNP